MSQISQYESLARVGGVIAVLAQAFRDLEPNELLDRVFASTSNSFYENQGTVRFRDTDGNITDEHGNTYVEFCYKDGGCAGDATVVSHRYNQEFGHGFLDIKAALLPIGEICVATGPTVDCSGNSISSSTVTTPVATASAIKASLAGKQVVVFDGLGTPFPVPASRFVATSNENGTKEFNETLARFAGNDSGSSSFGLQQAGYLFNLGMAEQDTAGLPFQTNFQLHSGSVSMMAKGLGFAPVGDEAFTDGVSILPNARDALAYGMTLYSGDGGCVGAFAFVEQDGSAIHSAGFALYAALALPSGAFGSLGLVMKSEPSQFMGLSTSAASENDFSALSAAFNLSYRQTLDDLLPDFEGSAHFFATLEAGIAQADGAGIVSHFNQTAFSGFAVGLRFEDVLSDQDTLTFTLRQPTRKENGAAKFRLATGRNKDRLVNYTTIAADLEPEARQLDFGASYGWNLDASTRLNIGGTWSLNADHMRGRSEGRIMAAVSRRF